MSKDKIPLQRLHRRHDRRAGNRVPGEPVQARRVQAARHCRGHGHASCHQV